MNEETSPRSVDVAVIGLGHWGPNHVRVFSALPGSRVVAVSDLDAARAARVAQSYPGVKVYSDPLALIAESGAQAVVISTPTATHYELVQAALQAGKDVLCEKPLCLKTAQAEHLTAMAASTGRILMVGHVFLFNPGLARIREALTAGEFGKPHYMAAIRTNLGPIRRDVNAAWDLASHDISIFNWLLGAEPEAVVAMGASFLQSGNEDVVNMTLRYPGNVIGSVLCSWLDPKKVRQLTVVGSKRMATWDDLNPTSPVALYEKGARTDLDVSNYGEFQRISMWDGDIRLPKIPTGEPLKAQAEHFIQCVARRTQPVPDGTFATGVVRALERISLTLANAGESLNEVPLRG